MTNVPFPKNSKKDKDWQDWFYSIPKASVDSLPRDQQRAWEAINKQQNDLHYELFDPLRQIQRKMIQADNEQAYQQRLINSVAERDKRYQDSLDPFTKGINTFGNVTAELLKPVPIIGDAVGYAQMAQNLYNDHEEKNKQKADHEYVYGKGFYHQSQRGGRFHTMNPIVHAWNEEHGEGFFDDYLVNPFKKAVNTVSNLFSASSSLTNSSSKTLQEYGEYPIESLKLMRTPVGSALVGAFDAISLGAFSKLKNDEGYDKFFHLSIVRSTEREVCNVVRQVGNAPHEPERTL